MRIDAAATAARDVLTINLMGFLLCGDDCLMAALSVKRRERILEPANRPRPHPRGNK